MTSESCPPSRVDHSRSSPLYSEARCDPRLSIPATNLARQPQFSPSSATNHHRFHLPLRQGELRSEGRPTSPNAANPQQPHLLCAPFTTALPFALPRQPEHSSSLAQQLLTPCVQHDYADPNFISSGLAYVRTDRTAWDCPPSRGTLDRHA
ncbi:hypothetical protein CRG98_020637 [Punica granatum]|uniref:Uncharacterized protein n=1 Tax=Punica granatum TaxID=22663 RepID=A0A2I0JRT2_PUNGR|nr:hypothetical protein CRG98_020637 [Punica granatum]